jgi:hypothetical protein
MLCNSTYALLTVASEENFSCPTMPLVQMLLEQMFRHPFHRHNEAKRDRFTNKVSD